MKTYVNQHPGRGPGSWKLVERSVASPGPGEVLIKVHACSLNFRDVMIARDQYGPGVKKDVVPVSDGAGEILAVGEGVLDFVPGDRVVAVFAQDWLGGPIHAGFHSSSLGGAIDGMLSEQVILKSSGIVRIPKHLSFEEAATLPCAGVTAWNALMETTTPLQPGATVLTLGTGGVSTFAISFAKAAGFTVIGTSSSDAKLGRIHDLGVVHGINYNKYPDWSSEIIKVTDGIGVDHVVEVGGSKTIGHSLLSVKMGGTVSVIGALSGVEENLSPVQILIRSARVQGILVGSKEMFENMNKFIETHQIKPIIDEIFDFDRAPEALEKLERGSHFGKIVIRVN